MYKFVVLGLVVVLQVGLNSGIPLVPQSMTPAELWNPFTWYFPYGIAAANAWSGYLQDAQTATNQMYHHVNTVSSTVSKLKPQPQPDGNQQKPAEQPKQENKPAEEPQKPAEEPQKPAEEPQKPAEEPQKPAEEPQKPAEEPQKPADGAQQKEN